MKDIYTHIKKQIYMKHIQQSEEKKVIISKKYLKK